MEIADILKSFDTFEGVYKHFEVDEAIKQRAAITPHLIKILENILSNPELFTRNENHYYGHMYAIMLLAHFKEAKAHETIIKLFSLPGEMPHDIFGSIVTEELKYILYRTANCTPPVKKTSRKD